MNYEWLSVGKPLEVRTCEACVNRAKAVFCTMQPKDILAISGKPGLYKVLNTTHRAIVVESIREGKRSAVPSSARVSSFEDISIFTYDEDLPLAGVLNSIHAHLEGGDAPTSKESHEALRNFVTEVVPDLDQERVYHSDLKKLCAWYNELNDLKVLPFTDEDAEATEEAVEEKAVEAEGQAVAEEGEAVEAASDEDAASEA